MCNEMYKMKQRQWFGIFAVLTILMACGQGASEGKEELPTNWKELSASEYSIQYPDTFDLDQTGKMGISFVLFSKQTSQQDLFRENLNLVIQDLKGQNIDLDNYVEISEDQVRTLVPDGVLIESKRIVEESKEHHRMVYTGRQGDFQLKWQQWYWLANEKAFVLTLTCEISQYDNYVSVGEKMMESFTIK